MRIYFLAILFISNPLFSQQNIVSGSYTHTYQFNLFDKEFVGRIQIISKFSYPNHNSSEPPDTTNYISNKNGLFYASDTSRFNLNDMFEGIHFDFDEKKKNKPFLDEAGRIVKEFDTTYTFDQNNYLEKTFFYPQNNFFIFLQNKNLDTAYRYMTRLFDDDQNVKRITYYNGKRKNISYKELFSYLTKEIFSEMYEFSYKKIKTQKKVTEINYYRSDEKTGKKHLYASNKYLYGKNNLVKKVTFVQFNGVERIRGEIFLRYFPD